MLVIVKVPTVAETSGTRALTSYRLWTNQERGVEEAAASWRGLRAAAVRACHVSEAV